MANNNNNQKVVPQAKQALNQMKLEKRDLRLE